MMNTGSQFLDEMQISQAPRARRSRLEAVGVRLERSGVGTCVEGSLRLDSASDSDTSGRRPCRHPQFHGSTLSGVCESAWVFLDSFEPRSLEASKPRSLEFPLCPCAMCMFLVYPSCPSVLVVSGRRNSRNRNKSMRKLEL